VRAAVANPSGTPSLDSSIADQIGQLATSTTGADARWSAFVAATGVASASAQNQVTVHAAISQNADGARQSVSGVSLDEEMSNMLMYQRAYEGAGRMMTAIDQMLDTLINRTGQVGR
jgi:flagellar hook-associated protein 1 FlgK